MAANFSVQATIRTETGKAHVRRMRRVEKIPAVLYGAKQDSVSLTLEHSHIKKALENEAFYSHILTLNIDGKAEKAVLRAVERHPYKPKIMHVDFQRISAHEKLTMNVPLHFLNQDQAPGAKQDGGVIAHTITSVEVSCLPDDLPEYLQIDIGEMKLDETKHLSDIKLPKGVEIVALMHNDDKPVVSIHLPRAMKEEEETAAPVAPPETEVITEKKAEEETPEAK
ncbi:MAG: 50S ribosomal protein L25/general stress protein Ctc [Gammaproteobacteria bacterium]